LGYEFIFKINKESNFLKDQSAKTCYSKQGGTYMCEAKIAIADKPARESRLKTYKRIGRAGKR
jgi:hypothetical protein